MNVGWLENNPSLSRLSLDDLSPALVGVHSGIASGGKDLQVLLEVTTLALWPSSSTSRFDSNSSENT